MCWFSPLSLLFAALVFIQPAWSKDRLPIIDAHSQWEERITHERLIELMNQAGVARTIIAARRKTTVRDVLFLVRNFPHRFTAAVRTKGGAYQKKTPEAFDRFLAKQLKHPEFTAMAEVLIYHAEKTDKKGRSIAPEVAFPPGHAKPAAALTAALKRGWPFITHIEFASLGERRDTYLTAFEAMLREHPQHPFVLIHMGQLDTGEITRLLAAHANLHVLPAHTTPVTLSRSREPWTSLFEGEGKSARLAEPWRVLMQRYPDRFVLGFDNVWARHWERHYLPQVALWRRALATLPETTAHAIAHGNAERLWNLPPAQ